MTLAEIERATAQEAQLEIIDCDVHPVLSASSDLHPFMSARWREQYDTIGPRVAHPVHEAVPYPRLTPGNGMRGDAWPENGGPPGSDLDLMQRQLLDAYGITAGILMPMMSPNAFNQPLAAAIASAVNEWQIANWVDPEPRLKGSICVTPEDPEAAIDEIEKWAGDRRFVQVAFTPRTQEPLGRKRYWPVLECAAANGLPIALHADVGGKRANSGSGWFGYYWEDHIAYFFSMQTLITSLIMEGVFERIPDLQVVAVEGGFGWAPSLGWRLDKNWNRMRSEVPDAKRPPSEYMRESVWYTTQPIEEPEKPRDLLDTIRWLGADRLLFSSDYPHWDFDDPRYAFKTKLSNDDERAIFAGNARRLYRRLDN